MPEGYKDCKFTMRYHEYMQWEIVYITVNLGVACRYLLAYVKNCIRYKQLDLLMISTKIIPMIGTYVRLGFWEVL